MSEARTPRDVVTREKEVRYVYAPPSTLPDPTPIPGMGFRWIATHAMGEAMGTNVSQRLRDGWAPVKAADHPELMLVGNTGGNVEIGGLMLCKQPLERIKARDEYYAKQAQNQMDSVDNSFMKNSDARMPLFADRKSTSSRGFGSGS